MGFSHPRPVEGVATKECRDTSGHYTHSLPTSDPIRSGQIQNQFTMLAFSRPNPSRTMQEPLNADYPCIEHPSLQR